MACEQGVLRVVGVYLGVPLVVGPASVSWIKGGLLFRVAVCLALGFVLVPDNDDVRHHCQIIMMASSHVGARLRVNQSMTLSMPCDHDGVTTMSHVIIYNANHTVPYTP